MARRFISVIAAVSSVPDPQARSTVLCCRHTSGFDQSSVLSGSAASNARRAVIVAATGRVKNAPSDDWSPITWLNSAPAWSTPISAYVSAICSASSAMCRNARRSPPSRPVCRAASRASIAGSMTGRKSWRVIAFHDAANCSSGRCDDAISERGVYACPSEPAS